MKTINNFVTPLLQIIHCLVNRKAFFLYYKSISLFILFSLELLSLLTSFQHILSKYFFTFITLPGEQSDSFAVVLKL